MSDMETETNEWQVSCKELKQRGAHLLKSDMWSDCVLVVGQKEVPFRSHKLILSMASPVFETMLYNRLAEENERTLRFSDIEPAAFESVLNYIYTENINISSYEQASSVYCISSRFLLESLAKVCATYMACNLTPDTACEAYEMAHQFGDQTLIDESLQVIKQNIKDVLVHPSFERASLQTVVKIFSIEDLHIDSELELFEAAERYAREHRKRNAIASTMEPVPKKVKLNNEEMKVVNEDIKKLEDEKIECDINQNELKTLTKSESKCDIPEESSSDHWLVPVLQRIRFLALSAKQFALGPAASPLLPPGAALALLQNIAGVRVRMPKGFSTSRAARYQRPPPPFQEPTSATFRLSIPVPMGIREVSSRFSPPQQLGGANWVVGAVPCVVCNTNRMNNWYFGVFLRCVSPPDAPWCRCVRAEFRLLATGDTPRVQIVEKTFSRHTDHGCARFITEPDSFGASQYVDDGSNLTVEVHMQIKA